MRSVQVHLIDVKPEDVCAALSAFARQQTPDQWLYPPDAKQPSLYIEFFTDFSAYEPEDFAVLESALGKRPDVSIVADVSGRVPGDTEVRAFVECLLTRFRGVADDECARHCWTWPEIRSGVKVEGHHFFDYEGWFRDSKAAS
jgi:hypothetical protein